MSDLPWNIWGAIAAVLGILVPLAIAWVHNKLPSTHLPTLVKLIKETQEQLDIAVRDGLITDEDDLYSFDVNEWDTKARVEDLSAKVYANESLPENLRNWWKGLTREILLLCDDLNTTRVKLLTRNSKERQRQASLEAGTVLPVTMDYKEHPRIVPPPRPSTLAFPTTSRPSPWTGPPHGRSNSALGNSPLASERTCAVPESDIGEQLGDNAEGNSSISGSSATSEAGLPPERLQPAVDGSTHQLVSNSDLQRLLSLALSHPIFDTEDGWTPRVQREDGEGYPTRHLYGGGNTFTVFGSDAAFPALLGGRRTRFRTLAPQLARSAHYVRSFGRTAGNADAAAPVDPESLLSPRPAAGYVDGDEKLDGE